MRLKTEELQTLRDKVVGQYGGPAQQGLGVAISLGSFATINGQDLVDLLDEMLDRRRQERWVYEQIMGL